MKRLAAYVFWEKQGIVRDYVKIYLRGLKEVCSKIYVVVNGEISRDGRLALENEIGVTVLQRPNEGVDFWAYKAALDNEGDLSGYDEVVLCNCSCYGPVYPFSEMFSEMGKRNVDFWGITEWPLNEGGYQGTWVLSYFMVFRPHIFLSDDWKKYWDTLCPVHSREECIELHETKFTQYFADRGFSHDVFCNNYPAFMDITIEAPDELVMEQRCPLIKRKAFCCDYERFLPFHRGNRSRKLFNYLRQTELYNTDIILDDLLATQHMANLHNCLQLDYILDEKAELSDGMPQESQIAACLYLSNASSLDEIFQYLSFLPNGASVFIAAPDELIGAIQKKAKKYDFSQYMVQPARQLGGIIEALHIFWEYLRHFKIVCVAHDIEEETGWNHISRDILRFSLDGVLKSAQYVHNIISTFQKETRLGILMPVNALHASYHMRYGQEWGLNYPLTKQFLEDFGIKVPIAAQVPPVAPLEGIFWVRTVCLEKLFCKDLGQFVFTKGNPEGSLYHSILRAIPFFAQDSGYLCGHVLSVQEAQGHVINLTEMYRQVNKFGSGVSKTNVSSTGEQVKHFLKHILPDSIATWLRKLHQQEKEKDLELYKIANWK